MYQTNQNRKTTDINTQNCRSASQVPIGRSSGSEPWLWHTHLHDLGWVGVSEGNIGEDGVLASVGWTEG